MLTWRDDPAGGQGKHCNVPRLLEYHGIKLGRWLCYQRRKMLGKSVGGVTLTLLPEHKNLLQALVEAGQLVLQIRKRVAMKCDWDQYYKMLIEWRDDPAFGNGKSCNVPSLYMYRGARLGEWLKEQRRQLRD